MTRAVDLRKAVSPQNPPLKETVIKKHLRRILTRLVEADVLTHTLPYEVRAASGASKAR